MPPMDHWDILIVDDDENLNFALHETLTRKGYVVDRAFGVAEAREKLLATRYPLVVTDVKMPDGSGIDLVADIKRRSPQTEVLVITAYGEIDDAVRAMRNGAADYIQKPFAADKLLSRVENHFPSRFSGALPGDFLTSSPPLLALLDRVRRAAASGVPVMIGGESGTGKEVLARFLHGNSPRRDFPYVALNCAAIPENLLESELFGYEKGAFTGADRLKPGKFELADRGTLVLDEIGDMPLHLQAKILRVIQEREVDRLGGKKGLRIDVRLISLTNQDIRKRIADKTFREDLYFRLNVVEFTIPPLRERPEDIPFLSAAFLEVIAKELGHPPLKLSSGARDKLLGYSWPGNVRELQNALQRAAIFCDAPQLEAGDFDLPKGEVRPGVAFVQDIQTVAAMEKELILRTLERTAGNRGKAAELLGISARTLRNKLQEYRLEEPPPKALQ